MFGYPDIFSHGSNDAESKRQLVAFIKHLHAHGTRPLWAGLKPCESQQLDFGCLALIPRTNLFALKAQPTNPQ